MPAPEPPRAPDPRMVCAGCGAEPPAGEPHPLRCPRRRVGDDVDHVLQPVFEMAEFPRSGESQPHTRYRTLAFSYWFARAHGLSDGEYVDLVGELDGAVAAVNGRGFAATPFTYQPELNTWIKDETGNVAGSHKARHLFGIMLHLRVVERLGLDDGTSALAIASCGNAALAAAVVARAANRQLEVFVPPDAGNDLVQRLGELGAGVVTCRRDADTVGDPCVRGFHEALEHGALPFGCQGNENGLTIDGGKTLGYEIAEADKSIDAVFVQVGGGALASACIQAFTDAHRLGVTPRVPRLHAVQTTGAAPLARAYELVAERIATRLQIEVHDVAERARAIQARAADPAVSEELQFAASHRSAFMVPWEQEPRSIARGILDDETYDWHAVVAGMLRTGGYPVTTDEATLQRAWDLGRTTGPPVCATGSAGLAGLLQLRDAGAVDPHETVAVLFTGTDR